MDALFEKLRDGEKPVIIKFHVFRCRACLEIKPHFLKMTRLHGEEASFYTVELGRVRRCINRFGIHEVPTFIALYKAAEIRRYSGRDKADLEEFIRKSLQHVQDEKRAQVKEKQEEMTQDMEKMDLGTK